MTIKNSEGSPLKKFGIAAFLCLSVIGIYFVVGQRFEPPSSEPEKNSPDPNEKAAALSGPALDGKTLSLSGFAGKVVLVDFWATWCDPCREEIPDLVKLRDKLKDKGFEVLGVSMDEDGAKAVKKFTAKQPISYPVALNGGERPPQGWVVPGLPTAYLIGREGQVLKRWFGEKDMTELEKDVTAALAK
jgi:peroxiredoxin